MIIKDIYLSVENSYCANNFYTKNFKDLLLEDNTVSFLNYLILFQSKNIIKINRHNIRQNFLDFDFQTNSFIFNLVDKSTQHDCKDKIIPGNNLSGLLCIKNKTLEEVLDKLSSIIINSLPDEIRDKITINEHKDLFINNKKFFYHLDKTLRRGDESVVLVAFGVLITSNESSNILLDNLSSKNIYRPLTDSIKYDTNLLIQNLMQSFYNNYMYNFKYKDESPIVTVDRCKEVIKGLGLSVQEDFKKVSDNLYSGFLIENNTSASSNGKGSTLEYTKASAYAEFIERLSNVLYFRGWENSSDFLIYPDETFEDFNKIITSYPDLLNDLRNLFIHGNNRNPVNNDEVLSYFKYDNNNKDEILSAPVYSVATKQVKIFPIKILTDIQYTSGMCAGNTPEEAISQGLSEIFERWASFYCWFSKLTPPEISRDYIKENYPQQYSQILEIENLRPNSRIRVYDYSLGDLEIPVLGILFVDLKENRFRMEYGSHPLFQIALERCLTEFVQGFDLKSEKDCFWQLTPIYTELEKDWSDIENINRQFICNVGRLPLSLFSEEPSWEFKPWPIIEDFTNKKALDFLTKKILGLGKDIYIRDNSFFGLNCYYIYVPELSVIPISYNYDRKILKTYNEAVKNFPESYFYLSDKDKLNFAKYLALYPEVYPSISNDLKHIDMIFRLAILIENGLYEDALKLKSFFTEENPYKIVFVALTLKCQGYNFNQIIRILSTFFSEEDILNFKEKWVSNIVENLLEDCFNSEGSLVLSPQDDFSFSKIYEYMRKHIPDQNQLIEVFN